MKINSGELLALMIVLAFAFSLIGGMVQGAGIGKNPLLVALGSLISGVLRWWDCWRSSMRCGPSYKQGTRRTRLAVNGSDRRWSGPFLLPGIERNGRGGWHGGKRGLEVRSLSAT